MNYILYIYCIFLVDNQLIGMDLTPHETIATITTSRLTSNGILVIIYRYEYKGQGRNIHMQMYILKAGLWNRSQIHADTHSFFILDPDPEPGGKILKTKLKKC